MLQYFEVVTTSSSGKCTVQKSTTSDILDRTYMDDFGKVNNNRIKDGLLDKVRVDQD